MDDLFAIYEMTRRNTGHLENIAREFPRDSSIRGSLEDWYISNPVEVARYAQKHISGADIYAFCFSESSDILSQWREYADDAKGVALGFDLKLLHNSVSDNPPSEYDLTHHVCNG